MTVLLSVTWVTQTPTGEGRFAGSAALTWRSGARGERPQRHCIDHLNPFTSELNRTRGFESIEEPCDDLPYGPKLIGQRLMSGVKEATATEEISTDSPDRLGYRAHSSSISGLVGDKRTHRVSVTNGADSTGASALRARRGCRRSEHLRLVSKMLRHLTTDQITQLVDPRVRDSIESIGALRRTLDKAVTSKGS